jgi:hypothetical protein
MFTVVLIIGSPLLIGFGLQRQEISRVTNRPPALLASGSGNILIHYGFQGKEKVLLRRGQLVCHLETRRCEPGYSEVMN